MENKFLILVSGKMRTGKNEFANCFEKACKSKCYGVVIDSYASILKTWCSEEFKPLQDYLNHYTQEVKANIPSFDDFRYNDVKNNIDRVIDKVQTKNDNWFENKNDITRLILQIVGTNLFRKHVDNDFWVKELIKKIKHYKEQFVIITDARFPNEIDLPHKLVEDRRVISIRVERKLVETSNHTSEKALDDYNWFDYTIENNDSLQELQNSAITVFCDIQQQEIINKTYKY